MKKTQIILIVVVAVVIGAVLSMFNDSSTYASLAQAKENQNTIYHVVGELDRSEDIIYDPRVNHNLTIFTMVDNEGNKSKVHLKKAKPQDLERSESIVLIGRANDSVFVANDMLMKCPSKYNEENKLGSN
ncbi:MAG: cytochrome c maturation protein CcmE domain-containing protein [Luteibaculaceae bacterium]